MIDTPGHSTEDMKRKCYITYFLLGIGHIFALLGFIMASIYKNKSAGTPYYSHFKWQIRTFAMGLPIFAIAWGLTLSVYHFNEVVANFLTVTLLVFMWIFVIFWWFYRIAFGLIDLGEGKPVTFSEENKVVRAVSETF